MEEINDGGAAFPLVATSDNFPQRGMSLREWFAGQALIGHIAARHPEYQGENGAEVLACDCYAVADAMIAAGGVK